MCLHLGGTQGDTYQHAQHQYEDKHPYDQEDSPQGATSFTRRSNSSTASTILGPCACRNNIGSNSTTFPDLTAAIWLKPGVCGSTADRRGAGGGAGVMVKTTSGLLVRAFSAVNRAKPGYVPESGSPVAGLPSSSNAATAPG